MKCLISIFELCLPLFSTNVLFLLTSYYWYQLGVTKVICAAIISLYIGLYWVMPPKIHPPASMYVQSQWVRANSDPQWHQNPLNFSNLNLMSMIMSRISTPCKFSFQSVQWGFSPDRWNITVLWLFSPVSYTVFFLGHAPSSNPWIGFYGLWFIPKDGPFGVSTIPEFIWR